ANVYLPRLPSYFRYTNLQKMILVHAWYRSFRAAWAVKPWESIQRAIRDKVAGVYLAFCFSPQKMYVLRRGLFLHMVKPSCLLVRSFGKFSHWDFLRLLLALQKSSPKK